MPASLPLEMDLGAGADWPALAACASALEEAQALAEDEDRSEAARCAALQRLAREAETPDLARAYEACGKSVTARRFRNWSELVAYAQFATAPIARAIADSSDLSPEDLDRFRAYCVGAHLLERLLVCGLDYRARERIWIPTDILRQAKAAEDTFGDPRCSPELRRAMNAMLDRIEPMIAQGASAGRQIADPGLRSAVLRAAATRARLARKLRRRDPLAGPIVLGWLDRLVVRLTGKPRS